MPSPIVTVSNLSKIFKLDKEVVALKNINLQINQGEFVALLGPNGAGKSTLIKILIGVMAYNSGIVEVLGFEPLDNRRKIIGKLGIVFGQRSRLWYDLPVKDSFDLTKRLYIQGYPKNYDQKWEKFLIDSIDIGHLLDRQVKKLSLGEKMRCELVNTLLYNPDLIFLDEPTIGLDVISKLRIREALKILHKQGKTVLLTSHDTGDIENLCQRVIIINHGLVAVDLPIHDFMKLSDEAEIKIKLKNKIKSLPKKLTDNFSIKKISDFQINLICPKTKLNEAMRLVFDNFEIADLDFGSQKVEKILTEIYQKH